MSGERFTRIGSGEPPFRERRGGGAGSRDVSGARGAEHLTLRLAKDTPRRIQKHGDREAVWLTIGAPPGEGITDGVRLDPATGDEISRA